MKIKQVMFLLAAFVLVVGTSAAWAIVTPTINIADLAETAPTVTTSGFPSIFGITNPVIVKDNEFANITGYLTSNFIAAGTYGAEMKENPLDPDFAASSYKGISDFATLVVSPSARLGLITAQLINLTFWSDGALHGVGFHVAVDAYLEGVEHGLISEIFNQVETGRMQTLFDYSGLKVNAASDMVPLPPSALLLSSGLMGLGLVGWRRRFNQA